jgi:spermidine/putrescine transport system substrate-binding protein
MRKLVLALSLLALLVGAVNLTALPAVQAQDMPESEWVCPEGFEGQTLRVFNWTTYVAEDTIPNFEEACGVTVEYFEYGSNEEMLNVIRANSAQYDIVVPSGNTAAIMIEEGLAQELDKSLIPNIENMIPGLMGQSFDPDNAYSIPYQWGTIGIGYDATIVEEPITSWADFFAYEGRVAWLDDPRALLGVALKLLGYDPNSTDEAEIMEAAQFMLDSSQGEVFEISPDSGQDLLVRGEVDAVIEYSGDIKQIIAECECDDFVYVLPEEGPNIWTDNMMIPTNSPNPALAHAFIDYILDPVVGAELSAYTSYATPNAASLELLPEDQRNNPSIYPSDEVLATGFVALFVGDAEVFYSQAWNMVNAELGGN